jgi:nitrite reductase/ring-hydroxylating ferredoxin subunit
MLVGGGMLVKEISGEPVLFVKLEDDFYAYRDLCPSCAESLEGGSLKGAEMTCSGCGLRYDVRRAGRCLDAPQLYLDPIPLLVSEEGIVKIALPSAVG